MMDSTFGKIISKSKLKNNISKRVLESISFFTSTIELLEIRHLDGIDSIIVEYELEVPSKPKNDIREKEKLAIVIQGDDKIPRVLALRDDFPTNISHINIKETTHPVDLCLYEQTFDELKFQWSAPDFLMRIKKWLESSSTDTLHAQDQALEPFLMANGLIYYQKIKDGVIPQFITKVQPNIYRLVDANEAVSKLMTERHEFYHIIFCNVEKLHGVVNIKPNNLFELHNLLLKADIDTAKLIANYVDNIFRSDNSQELINEPFAVVLNVGLKRGDNDTHIEKNDTHFFKIDDSISSVAQKAKYLGVHEGPTIVPIVGAEFNIKDCESFSVELLNPQLDFYYFLAGLRNDNTKAQDIKITLLGVGALGSHFLENMIRQGYGKWKIFDNDKLLPHNLSRHTGVRKDIGMNKTDVLAKKVNEQIFPAEKIVESFPENILDIDDDVQSQIEDTDYIIDISTSIAVARRIVELFPKKRKLSAFLNPTGTDLVLLSEDTDNKQSLDLIEQQYYNEIYKNKELQNHLFLEQNSRIRYAQGCRDITLKINQEDVSTYSGILSKAIKKSISSNHGGIEIWSFQEDLSIAKYNFDLQSWSKYNSNGWTIYLSKEFTAMIETFRKQKLPNETGGIILGGIDVYSKKIYLVNSILSPDDSIEKRELYIRGISGVQDQLKKLSEVTNNNIQYLGEWHSHPQGCSTNMSRDDKILFSELCEEAKFRGVPTLMLIQGDRDRKLILGNYES